MTQVSTRTGFKFNFWQMGKFLKICVEGEPEWTNGLTDQYSGIYAVHLIQC